MKLSFIIQARLGSTRLPNKILLPFYKEECIIDIIIKKLSTFKDVGIIVATTTNSINDSLIQHLKDIKIYRGDENDVLQRFIEAAEINQVDGIIRICSDNPFLDIESLEELISKAKGSNVDYISFKIGETPSIKTHFGFWGEFVTLDALRKIRSLTKDSLYHEHVTNYIYTHPSEFKIEWLSTPDYLRNRHDIRLTIDQKEDFLTAQTIYKKLISHKEWFGIREIIEILNKEPQLLESMKSQIKKNEK